MLKKNLVKKVLSVLGSFTIGMLSMSAFADPLDPNNFKAGTYIGVYGVKQPCDVAYKGKAILVVTHPVYTAGSSNSLSTVEFGGNLKFEPTVGGPVPYKSFDAAFSPSGVPVNQGSIQGVEGGVYQSYIQTADGTYYSTSIAGYKPSTKTISGDYNSSGSCKIWFDVS